jgi:hypothetical protein
LPVLAALDGPHYASCGDPPLLSATSNKPARLADTVSDVFYFQEVLSTGFDLAGHTYNFVQQGGITIAAAINLPAGGGGTQSLVYLSTSSSSNPRVDLSITGGLLNSQLCDSNGACETVKGATVLPYNTWMVIGMRYTNADAYLELYVDEKVDSWTDTANKVSKVGFPCDS